jgi:hypothetical protein
VDDNFHYMDEESRMARGRFSTLEEAIARCMEITRESVEECGTGFFEFGEDPWVMPKPADAELKTVLASHPEWPAEAFSKGYFSAWDYARLLLPKDQWTRPG